MHYDPEHSFLTATAQLLMSLVATVSFCGLKAGSGKLRQSRMMRCITTILVLSAASAGATQATTTNPVSPPLLTALEHNQLSEWNCSEFKFPDKHPYIAFTDRDIVIAKQRAAQYHWADAIFRDIVANAESSITKPWPVTVTLENLGGADSADQLLAVARAYALNGKWPGHPAPAPHYLRSRPHERWMEPRPAEWA